ncbi:TetR/AcrR family transcriptional regulator [Pseudonocardia sp. HH130630-07]|uniref:TetR/AcrR family transcriptional regulator n=1 Tax=Pseudonocardia sp. HH130630-07 TaxID=1690815 RepID=UPI000814DCF5|nr:TetR/AcrR family transcriptional regulator [Pseudonocardia sp. HH130630-07]ANY08460.1 hypothetical protein AFB00_21740 [Pseudonocardia sp. HH130630-07]
MSATEDRRRRRAERTRREIVEAGAVLFERHGLMRTTVEQIAEHADVSPATVYSVAGGKAGVFSTLVEEWHVGAETVDVDGLLARCTDPAEVVAGLGAACVSVPAYHRTSHIIFSAAPHDELADSALDGATGWFRPVVRRFADRVVELSTGSAGDPAAVADVLWFFFGYGAWENLRRDHGDWTLEQRRDWLVSHAMAALRL